MRLIEVGKRLAAASARAVFDSTIELVTMDYSAGVDKNGDPLDVVETVVWSGRGSIIPNLPRYERSAVSQPELGVEERRVVYYVYVPASAPVRTPGLVVRAHGRVYELIKEPLPMGGEPHTLWRLDVGAEL